MESNSRNGVRTGVGGGPHARLTWKLALSSCVLVLLSGAPVLAAGGDFSVDFVAAAPDTYDHGTGGGYYNKGVVGVDIVTSLQGGDFQAGDVVSWLALITVRPGAAGVQKIQLNFSFAAVTTGQPGTALSRVERVLVNYGPPKDPAIADDGGSAVTFTQFLDGTLWVDATTLRCSVQIDDLEAGEKVVVRIDTLLSRQSGSSPTGNLWGRLDGGTVIEPSQSGKDATISTGQQTVPFKKVAEIHPAIVTVDKKVSLVGGTPQDSITVPHNTTVQYSFTVTNTGESTLLNLVLKDNNGTPGDPVDDFQVTLTDLPAGGSLPVGASAHGSVTTTLVNPSRTTTTKTIINTAEATGTDYTGQARRGSDTATVIVQPLGNTGPDAVDDSYSTNEDTAKTVDAPGVLANDTDPESDPLTVTGNTQPGHGTVTVNSNGSFTYTPAAGYNGTDTFTYTISDGYGGTDTATVTITVASVNDPPVATDDAYSTNEDTELTVAAPGVLGNDSDSDGDALTVSAHTEPSHGTLTQNSDGSLTYMPNANYNGSDGYQYTVSDGKGGTDTATVTITVNSVNDPPDAVEDTASTKEDTAVTVNVLANDTDPDGDTLTVIDHTDPTHGTVTLNTDGSFTYTPTTWFAGIDTFTYTIRDPAGATDTATVTITVTAVHNRSITLSLTTCTLDGTHLRGSFTITNVSGGGYPVQVIDFSLGATYKASGEKSWTPVGDGEIQDLKYSQAPYFQIADGESVTVTFECDLNLSEGLPAGATLKVTAGVQISSRSHGVHDWGWYYSSL